MLKVLGENYYVDLDKIEEFIDMSDYEMNENEISGTTEMKVNIVKYELVKMMLEVILSESSEENELGLKNSASLTTPFKLAFNSLLNKKLINHY